ncbi:MAG TPA: hypothetical protein DEB24_00435 [Coriobacteriia bacterium]|nr:hypothetical protein [Coriobacteriia bacterium]
MREIVFRKVSDSGGQARVEYAIVTAAILVVMVALRVFADRLEGGLFVDYALNNASHAIGAQTMGAIGDVLLY